MELRERWKSVNSRIKEAATSSSRNPKEIKILIAAKYAPIEKIEFLIDWGCDLIGENRVQTAERWIGHRLRDNYKLHMIGHLQANKAAKACGIFDSMDTIDSIKLAKQLNTLTIKPLPVMIEVNISGECQKSGTPVEDFDDLTSFVVKDCERLQLDGVFTMTPVDASDEVREYIFKRADLFAKKLEDMLGKRVVRSYGMSDDFELAIKCGTNQVRLGRALFGGA